MPILASETYVVHYWLTSRRFLLAWVAGYQDRLYDGWLVGVVR